MPGTVAPDRVLRERYRLTREIAQGGIATVWEARDAVLDRPVAVKVLRADLSADDAFAARFRHEAVAAAALAHPNVVTTYDTGTEHGVDFIVLEYVDGDTLAGILAARGTLPTEMAMEIAAHVADALAYAHSRGVLHCDLKPSNIIVRRDGQVKVSDFGLAKACGSDATPSPYCAPEIVVNGCVDPRSDVYALASMLQEMLGGKLPLPLERALAHDIDDRFASAAEFAVALREFSADRFDRTPAVGVPQLVHDGTVIPSTARSDTRAAPTRRSVRPAVALAIVGAIALALAVLVVVERPRVPLIGSSAAPASTTLRVSAVADFDPNGRDHHEHAEQTRFVIDGNPSTSWNTERYRTRDFGVKPGVGLVLTLDRSAAVRSVAIDSATGDWSGSVYVADTAPADLAGWGTPAARITALAPHTVVTLDRPVTGRVILVWVTQLPPARTLAIDEVRVAG